MLDFERFLNATGYVTFAEIPPRAEDYPGALPEMLYAGSMVFLKPRHRVDLGACTWWHFLRGADVRHPLGPESSIEGLENHPAVHVAYRDVEAYAKWAGKELPTEAEWEFAARGGLDGADYAWGDDLYRGWPAYGQYLAGRVSVAEPPQRRVRAHVSGRCVSAEWIRTVRHDRQRVGVDHGLVRPRHAAERQKACCVPHNPRGGRKTPATTPRSRRSKFPARCSKAAPTCVRRTIAGAIGRPRVTRTRSTPPRATSASVALCGRSVETQS